MAIRRKKPASKDVKGQKKPEVKGGATKPPAPAAKQEPAPQQKAQPPAAVNESLKKCSVCGEMKEPYIDVDIGGKAQYTCKECYTNKKRPGLLKSMAERKAQQIVVISEDEINMREKAIKTRSAEIEEKEKKLARKEQELKGLQGDLERLRAELKKKEAQAANSPSGGGAAVPSGPKLNMTKFISIVDGLLEKLPNDVIDKFATSEDYKVYEKIVDVVRDNPSVQPGGGASENSEEIAKKEKELKSREDDLTSWEEDLKRREDELGAKGSGEGGGPDPKIVKFISVVDGLLERLPGDVIDAFMASDDFKLYEEILDKYKKD